MFQSYKKIKGNRGMTYVELIVVLSIFSIMTSVILFNYGDFQANVDIKVLANDIASKIVEAQKASLSGELPPPAQQSSIPPTWRPSYGLYFNPSTSLDVDGVAYNKKFIYFTDLDQLGDYTPSNCGSGGGECLDNINITKGNFISRIDSYTGTTLVQPITSPLSITFKRPDSNAIFYSNGAVMPINFEYIQITISSSSSSTSKSYIKIYPSGRIQIN